jgi:lipoate-protein ligase A
VERLRLLPFSAAVGPRNMARDELLLRVADTGLGSLRFYGWLQPTISLGYFQPAAARLTCPRLAGLPFVRRLTGGAALVHHFELTYALALPASTNWHKGRRWTERMHVLICSALKSLGVKASMARPQNNPAYPFLCFQKYAPGDLLCGDAKIAGSAERKRRGCLLQHGGILLAASPFTPELPGILELTGRRLDSVELQSAIIREWVQNIGWQPVETKWTDEDDAEVDELVRTRYGVSAWNEKR